MRGSRHGVSLLEVIIATTILVASSMVLLRLLSVGRQHQDRGERRTVGQIVCQSLIDQWVIDPSLRRSADSEPVPHYPAWTYTAELEPAEVANLVRVRIQVFPNYEQEGLELEEPSEPRPVYQLVRWMRTTQAGELE